MNKFWSTHLTYWRQLGLSQSVRVKSAGNLHYVVQIVDEYEFYPRCDDIKLPIEELPLLSNIEAVSVPVGPNEEGVELQKELESGDDVDQTLLNRYRLVPSTVLPTYRTCMQCMVMLFTK